MTINTTNINGYVVLPNDTVRERSHLTFTLIGFDTDEDDSAVIVPFPIDVPIAPDGSIDVNLWPNPEGVRFTTYGVTAYLHNGFRPATVPLGRISVPVSGGPYDLNDLLPIAPPQGASVDDYIAYLASAVAEAEAAAADSATARDKSRDWAESPTPPGDLGTKSAKTWAESILNLTASATTVTNTDPATATYDPNTGNMGFEIPAGPQGEPGVGLDTIPEGRIVGRQSAGTGQVEYLTATQARSVMGLGTAATTASTAYATAAQGTKADAALPKADKATTEEAQEGTDNEKYMTPKTAREALNDVSLSRVTGRLKDVEYTNNSGRPMLVSYRAVGINPQATLTVDGMAFTGAATGNNLNAQSYVMVLVPPGQSYKLSGSGTVDVVMEAVI